MKPLMLTPIGVVRSPYLDKADAPRQAVASNGATGTVELVQGFEDAVSDLEGFGRIWLLFWFDRAEGWKPKVLPPRSDVKRGVFATRSPHRPNPIGLSAVRLERVVGLVLHVRDLDLVDGTPIVDIKPYVPYADAFPDAGAGWLEARDPQDAWTVAFTPEAERALAWIAAEAKVELRERIAGALALGPQPHAYRRIRETDGGRRVLAVKAWRVRFRVDGDRTIVVETIASGYRERDLAEGADPAHALHRAFIRAIGSR